MKFAKVIGAVFILAAIVGCDKLLPEPTIDTSTDESIRQSSQKVRESLPEAERAEFDEAIQLLAFSKINLKDIFTEGAAGAGTR